jgi:hypothetical protein
MTRRRRLWLTVVVLASLLFQQVAVAAYACAKDETPPPPPPGMEHCTGMDMAPRDAQAPALCFKHCTPDVSVTSDATAPTVPALVLPNDFALRLERLPAAACAADVPIARSDPPPRLRFCSLLI